MNTVEITPKNRETITNVLAIIGFIAIILLAMWLAEYSTRFVPAVVNRISAAAVYIGSVFVPSPSTPSLSVVSSTTTPDTIFFGGTASSTPATTTPAVATSTVATTTPKKTGGSGVTYVPVSVPITPHGLPDLAVTITDLGYLKSGSTDTFVSSTNVPSGSNPAVKFTVKNIGTNWASSWAFDASLPNNRTTTYHSGAQQALGPNDSIDYILGFDQAQRGPKQALTITVDPTHSLTESNTVNNSITVYLDILGY